MKIHEFTTVEAQRSQIDLHSFVVRVVGLHEPLIARVSLDLTRGRDDQQACLSGHSVWLPVIKGSCAQLTR